MTIGTMRAARCYRARRESTVQDVPIPEPGPAGGGLIIVADPLDAARRRAFEVGADHALDPPTTDIRDDVLRLTDGDGLDLSVELAGGNSRRRSGSLVSRSPRRAVVIGMCLQPMHGPHG
jgi:threonine dehydrogenase-like Zn-dependent dehydrogenase